MSQKISFVDIFGVRVDKVTKSQAVELVEKWVEGNSKHYIVTPNPEFIIAAQEDQEFKKVLNNADLSIPDGVGLKLAADLLSTIPGVDLMEKLCEVSAKKGFTVGFLGGKGKVAKEAAERLSKKYPGLKVLFAEDGGEVNLEGKPLKELEFLKELKIDLLFVAFGQVKQEKWIAQNLPQIPVKVAMGVGGSFDYLSGKVKRAPKFIRNLGLEWLFRLITQPWRIKRQLALIKFVGMVISHKLT